MHELRPWIILAWVSLPTVMYGGYALLRLLNRPNVLTPAQATWFRAGHAHAGVLLLMSLLYLTFLAQVHLSATVKSAASATLTLGVMAQSGGFFVHLALGETRGRTLGVTITTTGAVLLVCAIIVLLWGLFTTP